MCVITDCCGLKALKDEDVSFQVCGYRELQSASASTFQDDVGRSCLWDPADATTNSSGCWRSHALATQINRTCSVNTISPLNTQMLYTMKVLLQPQPPTSSTSSSFGRQNVVKRNFNFILVTAHTHGFQKAVMFGRESLCPSFTLTIGISLHTLRPPWCCYTSGHSAGRWIQLGGLCSPSSPAKSASSSWEGEAATTLLTHGPSADPSQASWRGDATFPSLGLNITETLGRVTHQEGKRVVHEEILPHRHLGYYRRGLRPHRPIQPWAQQLCALCHCSPV